MIISDLNHLEVVEAANVIGGGYEKPGFSEYDVISNNVTAINKLQGNAADSFSNAAAFGKNTFTKTLDDTVVVAGKESLSSGTSIASAS